jgi:hypothetical protein
MPGINSSLNSKATHTDGSAAKSSATAGGGGGGGIGSSSSSVGVAGTALHGVSSSSPSAAAPYLWPPSSTRDLSPSTPPPNPDILGSRVEHDTGAAWLSFSASSMSLSEGGHQPSNGVVGHAGYGQPSDQQDQQNHHHQQQPGPGVSIAATAAAEGNGNGNASGSGGGGGGSGGGGPYVGGFVGEGLSVPSVAHMLQQAEEMSRGSVGGRRSRGGSALPFSASGRDVGHPAVGEWEAGWRQSEGGMVVLRDNG